ncbi:MAG: response regulator transcription factor [Planctomycetota bacterium]
MTKRRILVVEDEESMATGLDYALRREGYDVEVARDGAEALARLAASAPDLVLLDVMLPKRSGFDVLQSLRRDGRALPVVLLTAKDQEADVVKGFDLGADDYVTKPFGLAELLARVRARLRTKEQDAATPDAIEIGPARVDLRAMRVRLGEREHELSLRECDMLRLLWRERGVPVSRERFLDEVWGHDAFPTTRTVDQHVVKLRQKIEAAPSRPKHLLTAHGVGYRLEV